MGSSEKEIKRGAVLSSINTVLGILGTLLITPFILRQLGGEGYGLYSSLGSIITGISLLNFGLNASMVRFISRFRAEKNHSAERKFYGMCMLLFIGISFIALIVGIFIYFNLHNINSINKWQLPQARIIFALMCTNLVFSLASQVFPSAMTAYERFTFLRGWELFKNILTPVIKIILVSTIGINAILVVMVDFVFNIIYQILIIFFARRKLKIKFEFRNLDKTIFNEVANYSFFIFVGVIVDILYWKSDNWVLMAVSDNHQISVLNLGNHFADYFIRIATMLCGMLMSKVMSMVVGNATNKELTSAMIKLGRIQFLILGLILVGYIICGKHFVDQWAPGTFYHSQIYYIGLMLMIPLIIPEIQILGITILQAKNMHKFRSVCYFFIAVMNVLISIPLAKYFGAIGATVGTMLSLIIGQIFIMNWYYKNKVGLEIGRFFKETCKGLLPSLLIALILSTVTFILPQSGLPSLFVRIIIVAVIYSSIQWFFGMNDYEKKIVSSPVKKLKKRKNV